MGATPVSKLLGFARSQPCLPNKISFRKHHVRISWLPLPTLLPPLNSSSTSLANPSFSTPSEPSINQLEEGKKAEVAPAPLFYLLSLPSPCEIEKNGCALAIQYTTSGLKPDQCFCCCSRMFVNSLSRMTFEKRLGCSQINAKYVRIDMLLESEESVISNPKIPSSFLGAILIKGHASPTRLLLTHLSWL